MPLKPLARFLYFVGLPYLAIIFGLLPARFLGLKGLDYFALVDWGSSSWLQLQQAVTLTLLDWLLDSRPLILAGSAALLFLGAVKFVLFRQGIRFNDFHRSALDTCYDGLHWAFYRAIFWSLTNDLYLGVVLGGGCVLLEWLLGYRIQHRRALEQPLFLVNTVILGLTSAIFYYAPNLWLLLVVHLALVAVVQGKHAPTDVRLPAQENQGI
jgi:hypothetical protein